MASNPLDHCPRCNVPLVNRGPKLGRIEWACSNHDDPQLGCSFRTLRTPTEDDQVRCPNCHCTRLLWEGGVAKTLVKLLGVQRRRVCGNCGLTFRTREVVDE